MNKTIIISGIIFLAIGFWFVFSKNLTPQSDIVSKNGLHWHPELIIKINGENQEIPENVGMIPREMPIHTHAKDGVIHLEFQGKVFKKDIKLGKFFQIWGKTFNKDCIFDKCSGSDSEGRLKMFVNGKENFEFENYIMRDGEKIEIIFEAILKFEPQKNEEGGVSVEIVPVDFAPSQPIKFQVAFTTHEGDLDFDLIKQAILYDDQNRRYSPISWDGGSGGHHLSGILIFPAIAPDAKSMKLIIKDIYGIASREFEWEIK